MVLSVFERKWRALPRFQQTRGVLRLLALWVSRAYSDGYKGSEKDPLIGMGSAPLDDSVFRRAVFEQLGEDRLDAAVTHDIMAHAPRLDKEAPADVKKARLHRKAATAIFLESNGGQQKGEATLPEIRLAVGEPGVDLASVDNCVEALAEACYYLHAENKRYRFAFKANLNKLLADRRASVTPKEIEDQACAAVREVFEKGSGIEVQCFPESTGDIPDHAQLVLAVMAPDRALREAGTMTLLGAMVREHGQSSRVFKSAVVLCVPEDAGTIREEARKLLAWQGILAEAQPLGLDDPQKQQLKTNVNKSRNHLGEAVWRAYKNLFLLADGDKLERIDLGQITSSSAGSMVELILGKLVDVDVLANAVKAGALTDNWPPALPEWSTKAVRDAFYQSPKLPRITSPEVVKATIAAGVKDGKIAYAGKVGERYEPFLFKKDIAPAVVEIRDDRVILRREDAEQVQAAIDEGRPLKPSTPPPSSGRDKGGITEPTPKPPPAKTIAGFRWEGDVPWQKGTQLLSRVVTRFSAKGVKLRVMFETTPAGGVTPQELADLRTALKELGLVGTLEELPGSKE